MQSVRSFTGFRANALRPIAHKVMNGLVAGEVPSCTDTSCHGSAVPRLDFPIRFPLAPFRRR